jgi:hypothetical protein
LAEASLLESVVLLFRGVQKASPRAAEGIGHLIDFGGQVSR